MKSLIAVLCLILCSGGFGNSSAVASIIVSFDISDPSPLVVGGPPGTIDVLIESDSSDVLDYFQVGVTLTPDFPSPAGGVKFAATQSDAQLIDPGYVFYLNSLSQNTLANVGTVNFAGDLFSGFDATDDGLGDPGPQPLAGSPKPVTMLLGTRYLLFRLDLVASAAGTYEIDVVVNPVMGITGFFELDLEEIPSSSIPGTITVTGNVTIVPEPSSAVLLLLACACGLLGRRTLKHRFFVGAKSTFGQS